MIIVSDAGPLIGFAKAGYLYILKELFTEVLIPTKVYEELHTADNRPGAQALSGAIKEGRLTISEKPETSEHIERLLDPGEAQAIDLAKEKRTLLLIDERRGRQVAIHTRVKIVGTGRILLVAKESGLITSVSTALSKLSESGYRLSDALVEKLKCLANEDVE